MPIYDYECECGAKKKDEFVTHWDKTVACPDCGYKMDRQFSLTFVPDAFPKFGLFLKHVEARGKTFYSKSELKIYAKKHNLELGALL